MCFDPTAEPPPLPPTRATGVGHDSRALALEGEVAVKAFLATPKDLRGPAVVVLPDVRGLCPYYEALATRFADAGHPALAIDYFGRTAGVGDRDDGFDFMSHVVRTSPEQVQADIALAVEHFHSAHGYQDVVTLGFCFGGSQSYLATTSDRFRLSGAVAFYGGLDGSRLGVFPTPATRAASMRGPILAIFGGADPSIPQELIDEFGVALTGSGVEHEFVVVEDAPHSFFDRTQGEHEAICADAWERVLDFLEGRIAHRNS